MKRSISLFFGCVMALAPLAAPALSEGMEKTLGSVTFAVKEIYYDGRVAMLTVRQTAPQSDAVLVDEIFRASPENNPAYGGEGDAGHTIPTYCDISISYEKDGERIGGLGARGGSMSRGNPLDSYGLMSSMPLEVSPDSVEALITIATLTRQLDAYEEMDSLRLDIPKTDRPLVDAALDLDVGPTAVRHIVVSHTPELLIVHVYHQLSEGEGGRDFSVYPCGDTVLEHRYGDTEVMEGNGWVRVNKGFALGKGDPRPEALRLHYDGGTAKELIVDLVAGTVEVRK